MGILCNWFSFLLVRVSTQFVQSALGLIYIHKVTPCTVVQLIELIHGNLCAVKSQICGEYGSFLKTFNNISSCSGMDTYITSNITIFKQVMYHISFTFP